MSQPVHLREPGHISVAVCGKSLVAGVDSRHIESALWRHCGSDAPPICGACSSKLIERLRERSRAKVAA